ncbi:MAG TPA: PHB depolymerase family esterase [Thermomicrobiales bacterium]|nr:PHB depolymerase family esterase [Thermomicrobiales bacterium]
MIGGWGPFVRACAVVVALGALLVACGAAAPAALVHDPLAPARLAVPALAAPAASPTPTPVAGCGRVSPVAPGTSGDLDVAVDPARSRGRRERPYRVHVPTTYQSARPLPAVLVFHGHGGTAAAMEETTGFSRLADREDFLAVYLQALPDAHGYPFWDSAERGDFGVDDLQYVTNVLDAMQRTWCVAPRQIYATGFSNGGGMVGLLACRMANRFAAFAPVSGSFPDAPGGCHPARPAPILDIHGTADRIVPYDGTTHLWNDVSLLPPIPVWLWGWASRDSCTVGPDVFMQDHGVMGERWTGCRSDATVVHYRIAGAGHAWPVTLDGRDGSAVIWEFFAQHPLR